MARSLITPRSLALLAWTGRICFAGESDHTSSLDLGDDEDGATMRVGRAGHSVQGEQATAEHASVDVMRQSIDQNSVHQSIDDAFTPSLTPMPRKPMPTNAKGLPKLTRIVIEETDNMPPTGQPFGFNGRTFIIRPGEEVDVPDGILDILNNAKVSVPQFNPQTRQVIGYRDRLRIPYRVVRS